MDSLYAAAAVLDSALWTGRDMVTSRNSLGFVVICLSFERRVLTRGCERTFNFPDIGSERYWMKFNDDFSVDFRIDSDADKLSRRLWLRYEQGTSLYYNYCA